MARSESDPPRIEVRGEETGRTECSPGVFSAQPPPQAASPHSSPAAVLMPSSPPDASSMRRIGEALLMAQSRARVSTERANRSERLLRSVLSQINLQSGVLLHELDQVPRSMSLDSLADWDLLQTLLDAPPTLVSPRALAAEHTTFALSMAQARGAPHTLSSLPHEDQSEDVKAVARDVVMNLHVAARSAERRIQKMADAHCDSHVVVTSPPNARARETGGWLARMLQLELYLYFRPWQFMAGVMLGFALGVVTARRMIQAQEARPSKQPSIAKALLMDRPAASAGNVASTAMTCRGDALSKKQMTKLHLAASRLPVTFAMEDMSYLLHPPAEVS